MCGNDAPPGPRGPSGALTSAVGAYGERVAARYLLDQGMMLLARNWRCRDGEIDLILVEGEAVVFCEVKTRRSDRCGSPAEAVDAAKVRRLRRLAAHWLASQGAGGRRCRFDVVSVWPQPAGPAVIEHLRDAF